MDTVTDTRTHTHTQEDKLAGVMNTNMENEEAAEQKEAVLTL